MRGTFRAVLGIAITLLAVACGDDNPTVAREPVATVRLSRAHQGLIAGESAQLSATPLNRSGAPLADRTVSWRSENSAVATVTSAGLVAARGVGVTSIVAATEGKEARAAITVTAPPSGEVASIELAPAVLALTLGQMRPIEVTPRDAHGTPLEGRVVEWSVANATIVEVSTQGIVTAIGVGTTQIGVKVENTFAHAHVTVSAAPVGAVTSVSLDATTFALEEGATRRLVATPRDAHGQPITGLGLTWTTSDANIAGVDALGLVTGNRAGIATITARVHGKIAQATVTVASNASYDLLFAAHSATSSGVFRLDMRQPNAVPTRIFPEGTSIGVVRPSPDGSKLAFAGTIDGATGVFVANRDGSSPQRVVGWEQGTPGEPTWSPDGTRLAYTVTARGNGGQDVWVVRIGDPASARNLTAEVAGVNQIMPAWSPTLPDGTSRIAFVQPINGMMRVWTMRPDGSGKRQVTSGQADVQPAWSPNGLTIAYQKSGVATFGDIWLVNPDGANERALMPFHALAGPQSAPTWSPDGRMIAFTSAHESYGSGSPVPQVYTVWADGSKLARRTGLDAVEKYDPAWIHR